VTPAGSRIAPSRAVVAWRIVWTITSLVVVQALVCAVSIAPVVLAWQCLIGIAGSNVIVRWALFSIAVAPSYVLFALCLMFVTPLAMRLLRWHTQSDAAMRIADMEWPLLRWVRYVALIHLVRVVAGSWSAEARSGPPTSD
jgi:hypothetical protein